MYFYYYNNLSIFILSIYPVHKNSKFFNSFSLIFVVLQIEVLLVFSFYFYKWIVYKVELYLTNNSDLNKIRKIWVERKKYDEDKVNYEKEESNIITLNINKHLYHII